MTYQLRTKDGLLVDIPDNVDRFSPQAKALVEQARAQAQGAQAAQSIMRASAKQTAAAALGVPLTEPLPPPETNVEGLMGAAIRGGGPTAAGAAIGAAIGAPLAGVVGAIPGAIAGAGAVMAGDLVTNLASAITGRRYPGPTDAMRDILTRVGVPEPETQAEKILQTFVEGAATGLSGAGMFGQLAKAAAAPGVIQQAGAARVLAQMAEQPITQAAMSATGAVGAMEATKAAQALGAGPTGQTLAGLAGGVLGGAAGGAGWRRIPFAPEGAEATLASQSAERAAQRETIQAAERAGVPVMTSDVMPPKTWTQRFVQATGEKIPIFGMGGPRRAQQASRVDKLKDFLLSTGASEINENDALIQKVAEDLQKTRGESLDLLRGQKNSVIEKASAAGGPVNVDNTFNVIGQEIEKLKKVGGSAADAAANELQKFAMALPGSNLAEVEMTRKALGNYLKNQGLGDIREAADAARGRIYASLRDDMTSHIKQHAGEGQLKQWQSANEKLASMAQELSKFQQLKNALNQGSERTQAVTAMINSMEPSVIQKLYDNLSPQGQSTMKSAIVSDIAVRSNGIENLSPEKFLTQVKSKAKQLGVVLSKEEMQRFKDLQRTLDVTRRASQASVVAKSGEQTVPLLIAGGLARAAKAAGAVVAGGAAGGAMRFIESPVGRDLLMKMPTVKPGSKGELDLAKQIVMAMESAARETGQAQPSGE